MPHLSALYALAITHQITKYVPSIRIFNKKKKNPKSSNHLSNNFSSKNTYAQHTNTVKASITHPLESTPTYAQATSNSQSNHTVSSPTPDINKIMSTFIDEFKQLINPLIALLTKVISKLQFNCNSFLILQFNTNGLKIHQNELQVVLQEKHIDIALISETHFTKYTHDN
jgi:hypothetical protein